MLCVWFNCNKCCIYVHKNNERALFLIHILLILHIWPQESYWESSVEHSWVLVMIQVGDVKNIRWPYLYIKDNIIMCNTGNYRPNADHCILCRFCWDWLWLSTGGQKWAVTQFSLRPPTWWLRGTGVGRLLVAAANATARGQVGRRWHFPAHAKWVVLIPSYW